MNNMKDNGYHAVMTISKDPRDGKKAKLYSALGNPFDVLRDVLAVYMLSRKLRNLSPVEVSSIFQRLGSFEGFDSARMPEGAVDPDYTYDLFLVREEGRHGMQLCAYHYVRQDLDVKRKTYMKRKDVRSITIEDVLGIKIK